MSGCPCHAGKARFGIHFLVRQLADMLLFDLSRARSVGSQAKSAKRTNSTIKTTTPIFNKELSLILSFFIVDHPQFKGLVEIFVFQIDKLD